MPAFVLTRLLSVIAVVVAVTVITWLTIHLLRPESFAYDTRTPLTQLLDYLSGAFLHLDLGTSWDRQGLPVAEMLRIGLPADIALLAGALVLGSVLGIAGGTVCAWRP